MVSGKASFNWLQLSWQGYSQPTPEAKARDFPFHSYPFCVYWGCCLGIWLVGRGCSHVRLVISMGCVWGRSSKEHGVFYRWWATILY